MPPKPLSAGYFDGWYADQAATQVVAEIMNRHMGFPPGTRAGTVPGGKPICRFMISATTCVAAWSAYQPSKYSADSGFGGTG